jgi:flagellar biosynthesis/type III secretory pathway chaperone
MSIVSQTDNELDVYLKRLEKQRGRLVQTLEQGEQAINLSSAPEWQFYVDWINAWKAKLTTEIMSTKFINDHNGYLYAAAQFETIDVVLKAIDAFKREYEKAGPAITKIDHQIDEVK